MSFHGPRTLHNISFLWWLYSKHHCIFWFSWLMMHPYLFIYHTLSCFWAQLSPAPCTPFHVMNLESGYVHVTCWSFFCEAIPSYPSQFGWEDPILLPHLYSHFVVRNVTQDLRMLIQPPELISILSESFRLNISARVVDPLPCRVISGGRECDQCVKKRAALRCSCFIYLIWLNPHNNPSDYLFLSLFVGEKI